MTLPGDWYWQRYHPDSKKKETPAQPKKDDTYVPNYTLAPIIEEEEEEQEAPVKE